MSKKPSVAQMLAQQVAEDVAQAAAEPEKPEAPEPKPRKKGGRPKKSREVANRQTVYLDQARYDALVAIADDHNRSIHSIIIEGIDHIIGRPRKKWGD